jgi:phosphoglycerate kinase
MNLPNIKNAELEQKRILMRVDFNVEFDSGWPKEKYKIRSAKETIDFILSKPMVKLALLSHLGRPEEKEGGFSFANFYQAIGEILGKEFIFVNDCIGDGVKTALDNLKKDQVLMLENVRFYEEDALGDMDFAQRLAENYDIYVNEAFGVSHREHTSLTRITEILPSFAGFNVQKEVEQLGKIRKDFQRPAMAIIGGLKIETKLPVIDFFAKNYDYVLLGGRIGLEAKRRSMVFQDNVIIPQDYFGESLDIGPKTIKQFVNYISQAKTIVWNGPLGKFEDERFAKGTNAALESILKNKTAYKVAGGGETAQVLEENNLIQKFDFVSTGGGAMLEFLAKGTLPALEALKKQKL